MRYCKVVKNLVFPPPSVFWGRVGWGPRGPGAVILSCSDLRLDKKNDPKNIQKNNFFDVSGYQTNMAWPFWLKIVYRKQLFAPKITVTLQEAKPPRIYKKQSTKKKLKSRWVVKGPRGPRAPFKGPSGLWVRDIAKEWSDILQGLVRCLSLAQSIHQLP